MDDLARQVSDVLTRRGLWMWGMVASHPEARNGAPHVIASLCPGTAFLSRGSLTSRFIRVPLAEIVIDLADPSAWMLAEVVERLLALMDEPLSIEVWRWMGEPRDAPPGEHVFAFFLRGKDHSFHGATRGEAIARAVVWLDARLTEEGR